jgi:hypothetical protein
MIHDGFRFKRNGYVRRDAISILSPQPRHWLAHRWLLAGCLQLRRLNKPSLRQRADDQTAANLANAARLKIRKRLQRVISLKLKHDGLVCLPLTLDVAGRDPALHAAP